MSTGFFDADAGDVIPLITFDGLKYAVSEEAVSFLDTIRTPIATVSIAGRYRTGKSTLLNALCDSESAFQVGDSVQACTKGLHLRKTPLHASTSLTVFALDTEGISSLNANSDHDTKILALALLLSSAFLYNSVGAVDEAALSSLSLMTRVSEFVRVDADRASDNAALGEFFPAFYWVLRDFSLRLETEAGEECSRDEYLESALANDPNEDASGERNRVRNALRDAFPRRTLLTLPRPAEDTQRMKRRGMSDGFLSAVRGLRSRVIDEIRPMRAGSHEMTGSMLARVCQCYADALNRPGAVPTIRDSWTLLVEVQARDASSSVLREGRREIAALQTASTTPEALSREIDALIARSVDELNRRMMQPDAVRVDELRAALAEEGARVIGECQAAVERRLEHSLAAMEAATERALAAMSSDDDESGNSSPGALVDVVSQVQSTLRRAESDLGSDGACLAQWHRRCVEHLAHAWLPRLAAAHKNEGELRLMELDQLRVRLRESEVARDAAVEALARETERLQRDAELHMQSSVCSLQMQLEARDEDLSTERSRTDELEALLSSLKLEMATLTSRLGGMENADASEGDAGDGERAGCEADEERPREDRPSEAAALVTSRQRVIELETTTRALDDEVRELRSIRDSLLAQVAKEKDQREKVELTFQGRLQALQSKQAELGQRVRREYDEGLRKARDEAAAAAEREAESRRELAASQQREARAEGAREEGEVLRRRELRACHETQLGLRALCEDLQTRMVEMQRASLADLREREQAQRDKLATAATEQLQAQVKRGEAERREERAMHEVRELKRRIEGTEDAVRESKRLRGVVEEHRMRVEQTSAETDRLRVRLEEAINERERMRTAHIDSESERAALRRELELVRAESDIARSSMLAVS